MASLVARDPAADPGEEVVTLLRGDLADIPVREPGRPFLERRVDEARDPVALLGAESVLMR